MPRLRDRTPRTSGTIRISTIGDVPVRRTTALPLPALVEMHLTDASGQLRIVTVNVSVDGTMRVSTTTTEGT